jgi:hypothetical protein
MHVSLTGPPGLRASLPRAILALAVGAIAGGVFTDLIGGLAEMLFRTSDSAGLRYAHWGGNFKMIAAWAFPPRILPTLEWAGFLAVFGAPVWYIADRRGYRGWLSAILMGAGLSTVILGVIFLALKGWGDARVLLAAGGVYILCAALVGALIWRIAYRREKARIHRQDLPK